MNITYHGRGPWTRSHTITQMSSFDDRRAAERKIVAETLIEVENALRDRSLNHHHHQQQQEVQPTLAEQRVLQKAQQQAGYGFVWIGAAVSLGVFGFLRVGPVLATPIIERMLQKRFATTAAHQGSPFHSTRSQYKGNRSDWKYWSWLAIDGTIGFFGGFVVAERVYSRDFMTRMVRSRLPPELARLRESDDKSLLHTQMKCHAVIKSLQQRKERMAMNSLSRKQLPYRNQQLLEDPQSPELCALMEFHSSCQQRRSYLQV